MHANTCAFTSDHATAGLRAFLAAGALNVMVEATWASYDAVVETAALCIATLASQGVPQSSLF